MALSNQKATPISGVKDMQAANIFDDYQEAVYTRSEAMVQLWLA